MAQWLSDEGQKQNGMSQVNISTRNNVRTINSEQDMSAKVEMVFVAAETNDSLSRMI